MRAGELRDGQAVEAAAQILDGLAHAHGRGIIHRDVKPSNVLLAEGDGISVRLLDFGLAQFDEAETLTAVGDVPGTLAYISPERLRGEEALPGERRLGRRDPALGGARGQAPVLGRAAAADGRDDRDGSAAARGRAARTCRSGSSARSARARERPGEAAVGRRARQGAAQRARGSPPRPPQRRTSTLDRVSLAVPRAARAPPRSRPRSPGATMLPFFPAFWAPALRARRRRARAARAPRRARAGARRAGPAAREHRARAGARSTARSRSAGSSLSWRDARSGLTFIAGPLLAAFGLIALVPLAVQAAARPCPPRRPGARGRRRGRRSRRGCGERAPVRPGRRRTSSAWPATRAPSTRRPRLACAVPPASRSARLALAAIAVAVPYARVAVADRGARRRRCSP